MIGTDPAYRVNNYDFSKRLRFFAQNRAVKLILKIPIIHIKTKVKLNHQHKSLYNTRVKGQIC